MPDCTWLLVQGMARACPTRDGGGTGADARPRPVGRPPLVGSPVSVLWAHPFEWCPYSSESRMGRSIILDSS